MSATFLAAAARRLAVTTAPFQPAACDPRVAAYAESACTAAAAALAEGREEEALAAADAALMARPDLARAWSLRAKSLNACGLFVDMLASVPHLRAVDAAWEADAAVAQSSLQSLFEALPAFMQRTASSDREEYFAAWSEILEADPTSLQARSAIYAEWLAEATRRRDAGIAGIDEEPFLELAQQALACLQETAADATAYRASAAADDDEAPTALHGGGDKLQAFLAARRPNVPLAAFGDGGVARDEALISLNIGVLSR